MKEEQIAAEDAKQSPFDSDVVDEIGAALGVTYAADEELRAGEKEAERDNIGGSSIRRHPKTMRSVRAGALQARPARFCT